MPLVHDFWINSSDLNINYKTADPFTQSDVFVREIKTFVVDRNPEADFIDETNFRTHRWDRLNAICRNFTSRVDKERALEFIGKILNGEIHGEEINSVSETYDFVPQPSQTKIVTG